MDFKQRFQMKYQGNSDVYGDNPVTGLATAVDHILGNEALDLGIGSGRNTKYLIKKGLNVTGVDSSQNGLKILKNKINSKKLILINKDVLKYDFPHRFDLILSVGLMHFLKPKDSNVLLKNIQKNTKLRGINFIVVKMSQNIMGDLPNTFKPNELKSKYENDQWEILKYEEIKSRNKKIASIIARKIKIS